MENTLFMKHVHILLQAEGIYENPLDILQDMKFDIKVEDNEATDKVCSDVIKYLRYRPQAHQPFHTRLKLSLTGKPNVDCR